MSDLLSTGHREIAALPKDERSALSHFLHQSSIDNLYAEVARQALGAEAMGGDPSANGQQLFQRLWARIRDPLCDHPSEKPGADYLFSQENRVNKGINWEKLISADVIPGAPFPEPRSLPQ